MLNCNEEWGILSLKGIGAADVEVFKSDKGYGNGSIITGKRAADREIVVNAKARPGYYSPAESRRRIIGFFSIEYTYSIELEMYGIKRKTPVPCELVSVDIVTPSKMPIERAEFTATLLCSEPYFADVNSTTEDVAQVTQSIGFPMYFDGSADYTLAYFETSEIRNIYYNGTAPAPLTICMTAQEDAEALVVNLTRGDGKKVAFEIITDLTTGDEIMIKVRDGSVTKNGNELDPETYIDTVGALGQLLLTYGDNAFKFTDSDGAKVFDGYLTYSAEYNGV
jgi:hypothetical protein